MRARTTGKRAWPRSKSGRQQLREVEIVALEAVILYLAVAAEVDGVEATAEALDVALRELRGEFGEHRALQLEPFVGEVAAVMIVVEHHQRPRAGDEVAAGERGQAPRFDRFERLGRGVDAAEPRIRAGLAAALLQGGYGAERHQVVARPDELGIGVIPVEPFSLLGGLLPRPGRVDLLVEHRSAAVFADCAAHALVALERRWRRAVAGDRDEVQPAVASERLFLLAALDQRARRQVAGVLSARLERAEPAFVLAARRPDAAALVEGDGAVGKKGLHPGGVDDLHELVGHGIIIHFFDIRYLPVASNKLHKAYYPSRCNLSA